ncbi:hypothetical protein C7E25_22870, partial [Stenotrophomonas maltophilia]
DHGLLGQRLDRLFQQTFSVAKRARTDTQVAPPGIGGVGRSALGAERVRPAGRFHRAAGRAGDHGLLGQRLDRLFQQTFSVAKRARTDTQVAPP